MSATSKPIWSEGMLVRPQHFQQYDRWVEQLVENRVAGLLGYGWGIRKIAFDRNLLALGQVALTELEAIMPDGTALHAPEHVRLPAGRIPPPAAKDLLVKIAVGTRRQAGSDVCSGNALAHRYDQEVLQIRKASAPEKAPVDIKVASLSTHLIFDGEEQGDLIALPICRIRDIDPARAITLSDTYVPPAIDIHAAKSLVALLNEVRSLLRTRAEALAARADPSRATADGAGLIDLVTLSIVNGAEAVFDHFAATRGHHPETLFRALLSLTGQLSSFVGDRRKPQEVPSYRHEDLESCFTPLADILRGLLAVVIESAAISLPLQDRGYGILTGLITDRTLFQNSRFVLIAVASVPGEALRNQLPAQMKVGSVEQIRNLVNLQLPGVPIHALAVAPRELPYIQNAVYFELDQSVELWRILPRSAAFAFHVSGDYSDLHLEFWAIRGQRT
ncbi:MULTISPECIES: type VI secretion system baseplate subunit TssK [unclassified Bradyrhizobium]|uniref:type VI secretion system baseplate subunit TssK n=1 Tax=unclassified Bradyrhizobium TaxID=2631580 RepID=UPI00247875D6|nr:MULTISPECIES: type VI secretion system baseplate subunit TssK [unclassified Bradyrhizobium]WGR72807.1 type VI secretion system baseplate subunit TssK [Bradyrhizobium sp. ISRA426]WGR77642.1 type VI secretion system baseplate subunit TssK [Bradyrhizobium sp. ISRA430]WGR88047.1 type VI secretion system baseplate subunit TssK [Bradyrhizobium sp. ISRA432]